MTTTLDPEPIDVQAPDRPNRVRPAMVRAVLSKDFTAARRSMSIVAPMIAVPLLLLVALPAGIGVFARGASSPDLSGFLERMPSSLAADLAAYDPSRQMIELVLGYLVAPLFLIVPLMVSTALAADTFAGEKERRTLETLLHSPVRDVELFVAKVLYAFLPALAISWVAFALFCVTANIIAWPVIGGMFLPTDRWLVLIFWIAPAVSAFGIGVMVRVSVRSHSTQEANQLGGAVIMPLILAIVGQATALMVLPRGLLWGAGALSWLLAAGLLARGVSRFDRERVATAL